MDNFFYWPSLRFHLFVLCETVVCHPHFVMVYLAAFENVLFEDKVAKAKHHILISLVSESRLDFSK